MNAVLIGVDSGGTRTNVNVQVERDGSRKVQHYEVADCLSGTLQPELIGTYLNKIFAPLPSALDNLQGNDLPLYVWLSAAGFAHWTRNDFMQALHSQMPRVARGRVIAVGAGNDAVSLLLGLRGDGVVVAGTGSSVLVRSGADDLYQVGGHEWVACDSGSGFWIGIRAIRQAFRDFEADFDSVLLQRFRQLYNIRKGEPRGMIDKLRLMSVGDSDMKKEIARFAASVCGAAERGDLAAQNIVKAEAEELADAAAGAMRRRFAVEELREGIEIIQCGSVLMNEFYRSSFESQVEMRLRSGIDQRANLNWKRVLTGEAAAVTLAGDLRDGGTGYLAVALDFRPVVVRF